MYYIAIKWLVVLAVALWLSLCCRDLYSKKNKQICLTGSYVKPSVLEVTYKNLTAPVKQNPSQYSNNLQCTNNKEFRRRDFALLHYLMFFAGALAVIVYNRKREIISYTGKTMIAFHIHINKATKCLGAKINLKETAIKSRVAILNYSKIFGEIMLKIILRLKNAQYRYKNKNTESCRKLNMLLLKKLREFGEERNRLGQLFVAAIDENKNIRTQYRLETMAKNRLTRHIEDTQKQIKDNRSRYISFQQLYLVTHQENMFLKARITKLTKQKDEAERNLVSVINEIYQHKNHELIAFCSRFIVKSRNSFLIGDVSEEIQKFLQQSRRSTDSSSTWEVSEQSQMELNVTRSLSCPTNDLVPEDESVAVAFDAPKLRGLPGEYVWTVKDKDGLIEKLYEYDYGYNYDNGDSIRRIREYTVYHDKDCLLDISKSRTLLHDATDLARSHSQLPQVELPSSQRFLTGSAAFQRFLENNK